METRRKGREIAEMLKWKIKRSGFYAKYDREGVQGGYIVKGVNIGGI